MSTICRSDRCRRGAGGDGFCRDRLFHAIGQVAEAALNDFTLGVELMAYAEHLIQI